MEYRNDPNSGVTYYYDEQGNLRYSTPPTTANTNTNTTNTWTTGTGTGGQAWSSTPNTSGWQSSSGGSYTGWPQTPPYQTQESYQEPEPAATPKRERKQGGTKGKTLAMLLAVSLISGAAGGGINYMLMSSGTTAQQPTALAESGDSSTGGVTAGISESGNTVIPTNDIAGIVAKASGSVVEISVQTVAGNSFFGQYVTEGSGSGVIVSEDGYIVTNDHVIENARSITVRTSDGEEYEARLIGTDSKTDVAVLKVEAQGLQAVSFADSDDIQVGELAVAIGNPLGTLGGTVTDGIISAKDREITINGESMTLLQTSAAVNPGNSGGGLFNSNGDLIGVVNAKSSGTNVEGLGFAIPSNLVRQVVEELVENGYVSGRPQLGITVQQITDVRTAWMYGVEEPGVYVKAVSEGSPLEINDRILSVGGREVTTTGDVKKGIEDLNVGDTVEIVVKRGGRQITLDVPLLEQTPISTGTPQVPEDDM